MTVYRVCSEAEYIQLMAEHSFSHLGKCLESASECNQSEVNSTSNQRCLFFFGNRTDIFYMNTQNSYLCTVDISEETLERCKRKKVYWDMLSMSASCKVVEYAVKSEDISFNDLIKVEYIEGDIDDLTDDDELEKLLVQKYARV